MNKPLTEMSLPELQKEYVRVTNDFLAALRTGKSWEELDRYRNEVKEVIKTMEAKEWTDAKAK
ncbi:MAG: hypothetical protein JWP69_1314 [Flaviaesturariibacter sp.]|nr:hypothetical protein [Flaviaesturariibacter sp.]